jgi:hypothetical protein
MFTHNVVFVVASVAVWMTLAAWNVSVFVRWSQIRNLAGIWEIPRGSNFQWLDRKINSIGALTWSDRVTSHALRHSQVLTRWSILISFYKLISLHIPTFPLEMTWGLGLSIYDSSVFFHLVERLKHSSWRHFHLTLLRVLGWIFTFSSRIRKMCY